jgi:hypothetical protein
MVILLLSLIGVYLALNIGRVGVPPFERAVVDLPFSIYLGWITVATIANFTTVLDTVGWDGWGIRPSVWTIIMLLAGVAIATAVAFTRGDIAYSAVLVWATIGIAVEQSDAPIVATGAWIMTVLLILMTFFGTIVHRRVRQASSGPA